jgi:hypothetical protein
VAGSNRAAQNLVCYRASAVVARGQFRRRWHGAIKTERFEAAPYQVRMVGVVLGKEHPRYGVARGSRGVGHGIRLRLTGGIRKYAKLPINLQARVRKMVLCHVRK